MKTMNYEVELLKAWMDQGQRTECDETPIPPVMPEALPGGHTDAREAVSEGAFSAEQIDAEPDGDRSEPPPGAHRDAVLASVEPTTAGEPRPGSRQHDKTTAWYSAEVARLRGLLADESEAFARVQRERIKLQARIDELEAREVPEPLPELLGALRRTLTGSVAISSGSAGVLAQCRHCGFMAKRSDQDDALAAIPHKSDCPWAVLSRAKDAP